MKLCLTFMLLFLFPTSNDHEIVGSWKMVNPNNGDEIVVTINENYTYSLDFNGDGQGELTGTYKINGDQLLVTDNVGDCQGMQGTFAMSINGDNCTLTRVEDPCQNRMANVSMTRMK